MRISTSVRCSISLRILRRVSIDLGELRQALGVESIGRVEIFEAGLVEVDDGDTLQLEPVGGQRLGGEPLNLGGVVAALLVHLLKRHLGGDGAQGAGELALEQLAQSFRLQGAAAKRLGGIGDELRAGADPDEEFRR